MEFMLLIQVFRIGAGTEEISRVTKAKCVSDENNADTHFFYVWKYIL